jgi:hypothetical protein
VFRANARADSSDAAARRRLYCYAASEVGAVSQRVLMIRGVELYLPAFDPVSFTMRNGARWARGSAAHVRWLRRIRHLQLPCAPFQESPEPRPTNAGQS